jgi:hypothetical protein
VGPFAATLGPFGGGPGCGVGGVEGGRPVWLSPFGWEEWILVGGVMTGLAVLFLLCPMTTASSSLQEGHFEAHGRR